MKEYRLICEDAELLMQDYLDGYLLSSQREMLEEHISHCQGCREELLGMKRLEEQLEGSIPVDVPPGFGESVIKRLPPGAGLWPWAGITMRAAGVGLATAMAALLVIMVLYAPGRRAAGEREVEIVFHAPSANAVSLAGDFNDWNVESLPMSRGPGGTWRLSLHLPPGLYQYNIYIDHRYWADNPGTQAVVDDGFGGRNALLFVEG